MISYLGSKWIQEDRAQQTWQGRTPPSPEGWHAQARGQGGRPAGQSGPIMAPPPRPASPVPMHWTRSSLPHSRFLMGLWWERGKEESWCPPVSPWECWGCSRVEILWWQVPLMAERSPRPGIVLLASRPQGGTEEGAGKAPVCLQGKSVSRKE